mmetsp:Transcript_25923/g.65750  ORF Transcript_25923/g.65750 Transcript_25923/m.65750 type:complete len:196 (+) Transcript_25923:2749-3336(+)
MFIHGIRVFISHTQCSIPLIDTSTIQSHNVFHSTQGIVVIVFSVEAVPVIANLPQRFEAFWNRTLTQLQLQESGNGTIMGEGEGEENAFYVIGLDLLPLLVIVYLLAPYFLSLESPLASIRLVRDTFMFTLARVTFTAFFPAFAIARIHDCSWGNRAAEEDVKGMQSQMKQRSMSLNVLLGIANIVTATHTCHAR